MTPNTQTLNFTLTIEQANYILAALQELPAKISNPLTKEIQEQANAQLQPAVAEPASE
jgi:hypothetical protein